MPRKIKVLLAVATVTQLIRERRARRQAERLGAATLETLLRAIDANDAITGAHVRRVATYALILADAADLDTHAQREVERVALFHDIGKIHEALADIVRDGALLNPAEREEITTHTSRGAEVLEPLASFYPDLCDGVLSHHERWDGTGYPRQLKGREIPITARVVAIADTFDAITHARRYSDARSFSQGRDAIREGRGLQFDPHLVDLFLSPPVLERIEREVLAALPPQGDQRRPSAQVEGRVPDLKFRWRPSVPSRQPQDR